MLGSAGREREHARERGQLICDRRCTRARFRAVRSHVVLPCLLALCISALAVCVPAAGADTHRAGAHSSLHALQALRRHSIAEARSHHGLPGGSSIPKWAERKEPNAYFMPTPGALHRAARADRESGAHAREGQGNELGLRCEEKYCPKPPLRYMGGVVQREPHVHLIFWGSNWNSGAYSGARDKIVELFEVIDSSSAYQGMLTQYFDHRYYGNTGRISSHIYFDSYVDTRSSAPSNIKSSSMMSEVEYAKEQTGWVGGLNAQFVLLMAPGSSYESGFDTGFCGYHSYSGEGSNEYFDEVEVFDVIPWAGDAPFSSGCKGYGGGDATKATSAVVSHEYAEAATDPMWWGEPGWKDEEGYELADICSTPYDEISENEGTAYVQGQYDDHQNACSLSDKNPPHVLGIADGISEVNRHTARVNATVDAEGAELGSYRFEYGTTTSYGSVTTEQELPTYEQYVAVHADLEGLTVGQTYHVRVRVSNYSGTTYGEDQTFVPEGSGDPLATTEAATAVGTNQATLHGKVNPEGYSTSYYFEYGPTTSYGSKVPTSPGSAGSGTTGVSVSQTPTGLTQGIVYHYRLVASNAGGTTYGQDLTFRTPSAPVATTTAATGVSFSLATMHGTVNPEGAATTYQFEYGTTTEYDSVAPGSPINIGSGETTQTIGYEVTGLEAETTYHYRMHASNFVGEDYGEDRTFTTEAAPGLSFHGEEGNPLPTQFSVSGGQFYAEEHLHVVCQGETTGSGAMEHENAGSMALAFHGCYTPWNGGKSGCKSSGAENETILTSPLALDLVTLPEPEGKGAALEPIGENFAEFTCAGGLIAVEWEGGVIAKITSPGYYEYSNHLSLDFQNVTEAYGGREARLVSHRNGGSGEEMALYGEVDLSLAGGTEAQLSPERPKDGYLALARGGGFPATGTWTGVESVLRVGATTIKCAPTEYTEEELTIGSGEFGDSESGQVQFTLRHCKETALNSNCTTPGQAAGTIRTESLPVRLAYLADGSPGLAITANEGSGKVAEVRCLNGLITVILSGGVLAKITYPGIGGVSSSIVDDMNVLEEGEEFTQEYTETESGEEVVLQGAKNGGSAQAASLDLQSWLGLGGDVMLRGYAP